MMNVTESSAIIFLNEQFAIYGKWFLVKLVF
jgi:hypothetical protein